MLRGAAAAIIIARSRRQRASCAARARAAASFSFSAPRAPRRCRQRLKDAAAASCAIRAALFQDCFRHCCIIATPSPRRASARPILNIFILIFILYNPDDNIIIYNPEWIIDRIIDSNKPWNNYFIDYHHDDWEIDYCRYVFIWFTLFIIIDWWNIDAVSRQLYRYHDTTSRLMIIGWMMMMMMNDFHYYRNHYYYPFHFHFSSSTLPPPPSRRHDFHHFPSIGFSGMDDAA